MMTNQTTISDPVRFEGVNLFNNKRSYMDIKPLADNCGAVFSINGRYLPARLKMAFNHRSYFGMASCVAVKCGEQTAVKIEHVLSAVYGAGIDNVVIELSDGVVPRLENSVSEIVNRLSEVKKERYSPRKYLTLRKGLGEDARTVKSKKGPDMLSVQEAKGVFINYVAEYPHKAVGRQECEIELTEHDYRTRIMEARGIIFLPFGSRFLVDNLNLFGVTDGNSLLIGSKDEERYANKPGFEGSYGKEEFVRHKILDAIGTLALAGRFKDVKFNFHMTGHSFDISAMKELFKREVFADYTC